MLRRPIARAARPGLLRTATRTAVVAGTATAVSGRVARRQQASADQAAEAQAYDQQQQMAAEQVYAQPAPPPISQADMIDELKELAALKEQGVLTEAEFAAQKAKILGA